MKIYIRNTLVLCSFIGLLVLTALLSRGEPAVAAPATEMQAPSLPELVQAPLVQAQPPAPAPSESALSAAAVEPRNEEHDALYDYLRPLVEQLADTYTERPGQKHAERSDLRENRLEAFVLDIERALQADWRTPMLRERGEDWKYATTLVWIAHRETRIARNPRVLGNEDQGKAHGPWQIWTWKDMDPWKASTALDMLIENPGAWSLPKGTPWLGYPDCEKWVREHPFKQ